MKIAVVTGASSGMGREFVLQISGKEAFDEIWVIARRKEVLESLQAEVIAGIMNIENSADQMEPDLGKRAATFGVQPDQTAVKEEKGTIPKIRAIPLDLTKSESFSEYQSLLEQETPNVALLANCAGFGKFGRYDQIPLEACMGMIDLNCKALVAITQLTLPYMKRGAKIMQLDSLSAFQPVPYINVYGASKAFVLSYSRALNRELKTRGIRVMAVNPGWVRTDFFDRATTNSTDAVTFYNVMYEAADVMRTAIHDLYHTRKDVSIHGLPVKLQVLGVKFLPHRLVMNIWMRQQKHD